VRQSRDVQQWSLSPARRANAGATVGAILMIVGAIALIGSLFLPWERVDLQQLFGVDVPSLTFNGFSTGIGKVAGLLSVGSATAGVIYLALGVRRRRLVVAIVGLGSSVGAGFVTLVGLSGSPAIGLVVGLVGAVLSIIGGVLTAAAATDTGREA
jgi:hypothetical protein